MRANEIPNPVLRRHALLTHGDEHGNLEGAAAFAALAPPRRRRAVVRAAVAFQALYDYIDTLAEQPNRDPLAHTHQLHLALLAALDPRIDHADYYCYGDYAGDGDYVMHMIAACRQACAELPSYTAARGAALRAARRMVSYQAYTHCLEQPGRDDSLARWASRITPVELDLKWWETAAGAASSLGVFALLAAAAGGETRGVAIDALEDAYFPWIGSLHVLLDSFADRDDDLHRGHHSLVSHYGCVEEQAERLGTIADRALRAIERVPQSAAHAAILAAMISFYLSSPATIYHGASLTKGEILAPLGLLGPLTMTMLKARRGAARLVAKA
jgi:tetraprenyl-beta-curcumene synthase